MNVEEVQRVVWIAHARESAYCWGAHVIFPDIVLTAEAINVEWNEIIIIIIIIIIIM
jgi:hypothetical protein